MARRRASLPFAPNPQLRQAPENFVAVDQLDHPIARRFGRPNRRGSRLFLEQGHLAEKFVAPHCPQADLPAVSLGDGLHFAFLDDVHAVARLPLAEDDFALGIFLS